MNTVVGLRIRIAGFTTMFTQTHNTATFQVKTLLLECVLGLDFCHMADVSFSYFSQTFNTGIMLISKMLRLHSTSCTSHIHKSQSCHSHRKWTQDQCVSVPCGMTIVAQIKYMNVFTYIESHLLFQNTLTCLLTIKHIGQMDITDCCGLMVEFFVCNSCAIQSWSDII